MTPTKTQVKVPTPAQLRHKIANLKKACDHTKAKYKRQKLELWQNVYVYFEMRATKSSLTDQEIGQELVDAAGGNLTFWLRARKQGEFIRRVNLDCESAFPSSVSQLTSYAPETIKPQHLKTLVAMLNSGAGPSDVNKKLEDLGYKALTPMPKWRKKAIRKNKKEWADWTPEFEKMLSGLLAMTDSNPDIEIIVNVNQEQRLRVANFEWEEDE